ncbi:glycosyltransferase family 39 protein [Candidatus Gottesmanbacteria bacterium]|nr:glycosyltransferase family 39 protein [Candidatus Gottesmanbacteria bacterium]
MKHIFIGLLLAIIYFLILLKTLPDYGMNQDSPGKFLRGQTYLQVLTTGSDHFDQPDLPSPVLFYPGQLVSLTLSNGYENRTTSVTPIRNNDPTKTIQQQFLDYQKRAGRQSIYKHNAFNLAYWNIQDKGHPPVSDILMALSNRIFYEKLGWLGDVEAYHIYSVFLASIAVLLVYTFTSSIWGVLPALLATVTLATYPLFFAESHFNIKDIPELTFYASTLIAFYYWITKSQWRWYIIFFASFFLAFGTKWNILFLPFILIPWCWSIRETEAFRHWWTIQAKVALLLVFLVSLVLLVLIWPYLWLSPLTRLVEIVKFYWTEGYPGISKSVPFYYSLFPFRFVLTYSYPYALLLALGMTPLPVIAATGVKIWSAVGMKKDKAHAELLVLLWLLVPIAKHLLLLTAIYGSIRQYMEFLPALAIMAGIGGAQIITWVSKGSFLNNLYDYLGLRPFVAHLHTKKYTNTNYFGVRPKRFVMSPAMLPIMGIVLYSLVLTRILIDFHPNQNVYFNSLFGGLSGAQRFLRFSYPTNYNNPYKQAVKWLNAHAEPNAKLALIDGTMIGISPTWLRQDIDFGSHFSHADRNGEYIVTLTQINNQNEFFYLYLERFLTPIYTLDVQGVPIAKIWRNSPTYLKNGMKDLEEITSLYQERDKTTGGLYWSIDFGSPQKLVSVTMTIPQGDCEKHNPKLMDLFSFELTGRTFYPYIVERNPTTYDILFPAEETSKVRFDDTKHFGDTAMSACLYQGTVTNTRVLKQ